MIHCCFIVADLSAQPCAVLMFHYFHSIVHVDGRPTGADLGGGCRGAHPRAVHFKSFEELFGFRATFFFFFEKLSCFFKAICN